MSRAGTVTTCSSASRSAYSHTSTHRPCCPHAILQRRQWSVNRMPAALHCPTTLALHHSALVLCLTAWPPQPGRPHCVVAWGMMVTPSTRPDLGDCSTCCGLPKTLEVDAELLLVSQTLQQRTYAPRMPSPPRQAATLCGWPTMTCRMCTTPIQVSLTSTLDQ